MKSIVALLLLAIVTLAHSQLVVPLVTCENRGCPDACVSNPVRCVSSCSATKACTQDEICLNGWCQTKRPLTCSTVDCLPGYFCRNGPARCVKTCQTKQDCNPGTDCLNKGCETVPYSG